MKNIIFTSLLCCFIHNALSQNHFVTKWKTDNPGASSPTSIIIPTFPGETYNYDVSWKNDGVWETNFTGNATHDYGTAGTYTVAIRGTFPRIYFNRDNQTDLGKIVSIEQWGANPWSSMEQAFAGCQNLMGNATDTPNLSGVTSMSYMFFLAEKFNQDIGNWNVSNVTNLKNMFAGARTFNQNIGNWDVSNVTDMERMFQQAEMFNQDIGGWNVGNVANMRIMFSGAMAFNQNIGNWNVSNVTDMFGMFQLAESFNQDIGGWNVGNVTNMHYMFGAAKAFNQNIGNWNVSNVIDMSAMFFGALEFDQNLGNWNVSNVTDMHHMLTDTALSTTNYDALLNGWNLLSLKSNVNFGAGNSQYCGSEAARASIISNFSWIITDGGKNCLGVNENKLLSNIKLYPNPLKADTFYINAPGINGEKLMVSILDLSGRIIYDQQMECFTNFVSIEVGNQLTTGVYLVRLQLGKETSTYRLIRD